VHGSARLLLLSVQLAQRDQYCVNFFILRFSSGHEHLRGHMCKDEHVFYVLSMSFSGIVQYFSFSFCIDIILTRNDVSLCPFCAFDL